MCVCVYPLLQIPEDDEVFQVRLTGVGGGALLRPNGSAVALRVRRNDSPLRFSQPALAVPETAGVIALTVTRGRLTEGGPLIGSDDTEVGGHVGVCVCVCLCGRWLTPPSACARVNEPL